MIPPRHLIAACIIGLLLWAVLLVTLDRCAARAEGGRACAPCPAMIR